MSVDACFDLGDRADGRGHGPGQLQPEPLRLRFSERSRRDHLVSGERPLVSVRHDGRACSVGRDRPGRAGTPR
jgi:hypothetical protein